MARTKPTSRSAKILYRPVGMLSGIVGGIVAGQVFDQLWQRATPRDDGAPQPLESRYGVAQVVAAAAVQGAVFAAVRAAVDRGGARLFQHWTGEWPGD